jgi:hypothetical protein
VEERGVSFATHRRGLEVLGAQVSIVHDTPVAAKNAPAYAARLMGPEALNYDPAREEPAKLLQPGEMVAVLGPAQTSPTTGVAYAPVAVWGLEGPHWIRASSLGPRGQLLARAAGAPVVSSASSPSFLDRYPTWQIALGVLAAAAGGYWLYRLTRKR